MRMNQFPLVSNSATTGHKLQGKTVSSIMIYEWTYKFMNWACVVLSRVGTMNGVYIRKGNGLSEDVDKYKVPEELKVMLQGFRGREPAYISIQEYEEAIGDNYIGGSSNSVSSHPPGNG